MVPVTSDCRGKVGSDNIHYEVHAHVRCLGVGGYARAGARGAACELGRGGTCAPPLAHTGRTVAARLLGARCGLRTGTQAQRTHERAAVRTGSASGGAAAAGVSATAGATSCATAVGWLTAAAGAQVGCTARGAAESCAVYGGP